MTNKTDIQFDNGAITLAGNLLPDGFDDAGSYPAIIAVHPAGGRADRNRAGALMANGKAAACPRLSTQPHRNVINHEQPQKGRDHECLVD